MLKQVRNAFLRRAVQATTDAAVDATSKAFRQTFTVTFPVTVYVRASHSHVTIRKLPGTQVVLDASIRASFGWEFVTDQDSDGVYIVARRKPVLGALSAARFTLSIPSEANLVLHLTPGSVQFVDVDGKLSLPAQSW